MKFKPGDIVELKSGGPRMTISSTSHFNATVQWFNLGDTLYEATVKLTSLKPKENHET